MKELPAGRETHVSPLHGLLTRLRVLARRRAKKRKRLTVSG